MADEAPTPVIEAPVESTLTTTPDPIPEPKPVEAKVPLEQVLYGKEGETAPAEPAEAAAPDAEAKESADTPKAESEVPKEGLEAPAPLTAESYADLKLPEGLVVDDALFAKAKEAFASVGVLPAKAPELLDFYKETQTQQLAALQKEISDQDARWSKELDAIPEFKGEQRKVASQFIGRAIEEFGSPEVRQTLEAYKLGNNPALARFIYNLAYAVVEGEPTSSGGAAPVGKNGQPGRQPLAESLYDHPDSAKARTN